MRSHATRSASRFIRLATQFDEQSLPDEFVLPETFDDVDDESLAALEATAVEAFDAIRLGGDTSEAALTALESLADAVDTIRAEQTSRNETAEANAERVAELAARVAPDAEASESDESDADGDESVDAADAADDAAESDVDDESAADAEDDDAVVDEDGNTVVAPDDASALDEPAPIAASSRRSRPTRVSLAGIRRSGPTNDTPDAEQPRATIRAAADTGHAAGANIDLQGVADAATRVIKSLRAGGGQRAVAVMEFDVPDGHDIGEHDNADSVVETVLAAAVPTFDSERRTITAAGPYCAPAEQFYDVCDGLESMEGMLEHPEVGLSRGSASIFGGFDLNDASLDDLGFEFDRAQHEAGDYDGGPDTPKPCERIPCLTPSTVELEGDGLCIQTDVLQSRFAPEQRRRWVEVALNRFAHDRNAKIIAATEAATTQVVIPDSNGLTAHIMATTELLVEHYRNRYNMARNTVFDFVLPYWAHGPIRSDLTKRLGIPFASITNAQIDAEFAARGVRPRFVYDWQVNRVDNTIDIGGATVPTNWPARLRAMLYPAGTFIKYTGGEINVDAIVDQELVRNNNEHVLFMEELWVVDDRCYDSFTYDINVCPDGSTQGGIDLACDRP